MLEENVSKINNYFDGQNSLCVQRRMDLRAEGRMDESVFENVKENVYNIFRSVLSASVKTSKNDPVAAKDFFLQKLEEIPSNWRMAYETARQNDDAGKMQIEQIKLAAVREIREAFSYLWEV